MMTLAANVLDRDFTAAARDLYSRFVVGWAVSAVNDRRLTITALQRALERRCRGAGLLHHSDRGCTYTAEDYQAILTARGITCGMSRRGKDGGRQHLVRSDGSPFKNQGACVSYGKTGQ